MTCDHCGRHLASLPYTCKRCGKEYCTKHRLPESHDCIVLKVEKFERAVKREEGENSGPWFKDEFRLSKVNKSESGKHSVQKESAFDKHSHKRQKGEEIKKAAQRAEEKRYPDIEPTPDLAPDGSLVHPHGDTHDDHSEEVNIGSTYTTDIRKHAWVFIIVITLIISLLIYGFYFHT